MSSLAFRWLLTVLTLVVVGCMAYDQYRLRQLSAFKQVVAVCLASVLTANVWF
jgi:hypothetical protein